MPDPKDTTVTAGIATGAPRPGDPQHHPGLTLDAYATAKGLSAGTLSHFGVKESRGRMGAPYIVIPYRDEKRRQVQTRLRFQLAKTDPDFRFRWPTGEHAMLYNLPCLPAAREYGRLLLVEGESDVQAAYERGICLVVGVPGNTQWRDEWAPLFDGVAEIYVWKEPGADAFEGAIAASLARARFIDAADTGYKDLGEAHLAGVPCPAWLDALIATARPGDPALKGQRNGHEYPSDGRTGEEWLRDYFADAAGEEEEGEGAADDGLQDGDLIVINAADVTPEKVRFLWDRRIARGKINILDGDPGAGKSGITVKLAAHETTGEPYPDDRNQAWREPRNVVIICAEDDPADTIVPRLIAAGADLNRVRIVQMTKNRKGDRVFDATKDLPKLAQLAKELAPSLIVIDPLVSHIGDTNPNKSTEMRQALAPVALLAAKSGAAVVINRHLNKQGGVAALYRGAGSIDIVGIARSVMLAAEDKQGNCFLVRTKSNLAAKPKAIRYARTDVDDVLRIEWEGTADIGADELLNGDGDVHSPEQQKILDALKAQRMKSRTTPGTTETMTPKDIHLVVKGNESAIRKNLRKLEDRGMVERVAHGRYRLPDDDGTDTAETPGETTSPGEAGRAGGEENPFGHSSPTGNNGNNTHTGNNGNNGHSETVSKAANVSIVAIVPGVATIDPPPADRPIDLTKAKVWG